jgi:hypothetical protein
MKPERFANPFCNPVHFPVACDPASVCENANGPARAVPQPIPTATKHNSTLAALSAKKRMPESQFLHFETLYLK